MTVDGPDLGADRARRRVPPGDLRPRERLHQRHHARPDEARDRSSASTRSSSSPSCSDFIDAPVKTYSSGHVHAPRVRRGHSRRSRRAAGGRSAGRRRRGLHAQVPRQVRRVPAARQDDPARHALARPGRALLRRGALARRRAARRRTAIRGASSTRTSPTSSRARKQLLATTTRKAVAAVASRAGASRRRRRRSRRPPSPSERRRHVPGGRRAAGARARSRSPTSTLLDARRAAVVRVPLRRADVGPPAGPRARAGRRLRVRRQPLQRRRRLLLRHEHLSRGDGAGAARAARRR